MRDQAFLEAGGAPLGHTPADADDDRCVGPPPTARTTVPGAVRAPLGSAMIRAAVMAEHASDQVFSLL
uniref:Uncharacterized protein n=1 Tax=Streptomyces auratus AGR0001 TaxID=1160718 RepID=J1S5A8_9ACTN